jgi:hypothetical protein
MATRQTNLRVLYGLLAAFVLCVLCGLWAATWTRDQLNESLNWAMTTGVVTGSRVFAGGSGKTPLCPKLQYTDTVSGIQFSSARVQMYPQDLPGCSGGEWAYDYLRPVSLCICEFRLVIHSMTGLRPQSAIYESAIVADHRQKIFVEVREPFYLSSCKPYNRARIGRARLNHHKEIEIICCGGNWKHIVSNEI